MQYLVVSLGDAKEATPTINKTLNPEWNTTLEMPVVGEQNLLLEATCWDKDRFGKDYMGEFDVILEDVFAHARRGEVLPQKTTYFFPKLISGLLVHPL